MLDKASRLCNSLLEVYAIKLNRLGKNMKKKVAIKNRPESLSLKRFFSEDDETLESDKKDIHDMPPMPPLEGDEGEFVDIQPIEPPD